MKQSSQLSISPELVQALRSAHSITVLTGAGISAESGIPTFRNSQTGLWAQYNPHQLATPQAFQENPNLVLDWYRWRHNLVDQSTPNPGHLALAEMEKQVDRFTLITQNVDGLHLMAGSHNVIELHGNIHRLRCSQGESVFSDWTEETIPHCPNCGAILRPDIVWFGESLPVQAFQAALNAAKNCDVFFSVGTSGVVEPAASLPYEALRAGAVVVEINPNPTPLTVHARYYFPYPAGQVLPILMALVWNE